MNTSEHMTGFAMKRLYGWLDKDPEKNIPKVLDYLVKFDPDGTSLTHQVEGIKNALADPNNNWSKLVKSLWTDIDAGQRKKLVETAVVNGTLIGTPKTMRMQDKYQCNVPWAILMDPTSACNLHCTGCWAAEYGNKLNLTFDELDSVIQQGKRLGTYIYIYSGGEPLVRKADIIKLCEKHRGFEEATDSRRGKGTYQKVIEAMERLKARQLLFGISCCYTSANVEVIGSEEYFDSMIDMGAKFAWLFTYMPIGADAVPELIATAEQRKFMYERIHEYRKTKPLFTMDFWNDGDAVGGSCGVVAGPVRVKDIVLGQMVQGLGVDVPKQAPQPAIQAAGPVRTRLLQQGVGNGAAWPRLGIHAIHPIHQLRQMHLRVRIDGVQDMLEPHGDRCSRVVHTLSFPSIVRPGGLQPFLAILPVYWVPFRLGMFSHISSATGAQRSAVATQRLQ